MTELMATAAKQLSRRLPAALTRLADLAYNYWWSWTPDKLSLFKMLDPDLWEQYGHNAVKLLQNVSYDRLTQVAEDPRYVQRVNELVSQFDLYMGDRNTWSQRVAPQISPEHPVAYFCAEFGIHESLPIYSGGLGILAGDHLKSASDLGIPMVGVGLLYRQGYFRQRLSLQGWQEDYYVDNEFETMPLELMCDAIGQPIVVEIQVRQRIVRAQIWRADVGRVSLYLLDTDRDDNDPIDRWLTGHLYGGNRETRIAQEIVLGIGGVRALAALEIEPSVYHLNEGHAAFCLLEVARQDMARTSKSFYDVEGLVCDRAVFTTHTPVPAGHDVFSPDLIDSFFAHYWPQLGLSRDQFLALGARRLGDPWEPFSMTVLALRLTRSANGVSALHGQVSRQMWRVLYPERSEGEVPIGHITNGVHSRSWIAPLLVNLFDRYLGDGWSTHMADPSFWAKVDDIPNEELWRCHQVLKERLIAFARTRIRKARQLRGESHSDVHATEHLLDPNCLTIGFARRFSTYKRGALLLHDVERAMRILSNGDRPVQLLFSGKAHPADEEGKRIIQRIMEWRRHPAICDRVAFIEDYDIFTAQKLVQGVDIWLNNPRRPLEASGTSGQKVAMNGGLNFSVLDGWWCEGYQVDPSGKGINGWAIGKDAHTSDQDIQDKIDADSLYQILEEEIVPLYYDQDKAGIPHGWVAKMKASIRTNTPAFNTDRMLADYVAKVYAPGTTIETQAVMANVPAL